MFLMKKRTKNSYIEILEFIKKIYREKCGEELCLKSIHSDAEYSFLSAMQEIFPRTNIFLCSVHILRAIQKNFKSKVSGIFYQNPDLLYIWRVLSGSLFLNLCDENILNEIITFLNGCDFLRDTG